MKTALESIAGMECLTVRGEVPEVAVVFLHGYGANMHDLFPLWEMWHRDKFSWFFPNGVLPLPMGYYEGRAWFSIDMERLERSMREGTERDMDDTVPPELDETLRRLGPFLGELRGQFKKVVLGGFSQGAMCSSHLAMRQELSLDGLVLLSGSLLARAKLTEAARPLPFYQSHGTADPVLPFSGARRLEEKLQSLNFRGKLHSFSGGHEIPLEVISGVKAFLAQFAD